MPVSANGWPSPGPCSATCRWYCSTSPPPIWTPRPSASSRCSCPGGRRGVPWSWQPTGRFWWASTGRLDSRMARAGSGTSPPGRSGPNREREAVGTAGPNGAHRRALVETARAVLCARCRRLFRHRRPLGGIGLPRGSSGTPTRPGRHCWIARPGGGDGIHPRCRFVTASGCRPTTSRCGPWCIGASGSSTISNRLLRLGFATGVAGIRSPVPSVTSTRYKTSISAHSPRWSSPRRCRCWRWWL